MRYSSTAVLALVAVAAPAVARAGGEADPGFGDRKLRGHTFLAPMLQESAFVTTHFGFRQGFAYEGVPGVAVGGAPFELQTAGLTETAEGGLQITDWLGVYGALAGRVTTGLSSDSIFFVGSSYDVSGQLGGIFRIARVRETGTQISARVSIAHGAGEGIEPSTLLRSLSAQLRTSEGTRLATAQLLNNQLVRSALVPSSSTELGGSIHAAQTLFPSIGLQASGFLYSVAHYGTRPDSDTGRIVDLTEKDLRGGFALSASFDARDAGVPVAAMIEYAVGTQSFPSATRRTKDTTHLVGIGVYYTRAENLQLGIGVGTQLGAQPIVGQDALGRPLASDSPKLVFAQLVMRYVW